MPNLVNRIGGNGITRGDNEVISLVFEEVDNGVTTRLDLTGATVYFTVKTLTDLSNDDSSAVIKKTITSHLNPTNGETVIELDDADWVGVTYGMYKYDISIKDAFDKKNTLMYGNIEIVNDVTKAI